MEPTLFRAQRTLQLRQGVVRRIDDTLQATDLAPLAANQMIGQRRRVLYRRRDRIGPSDGLFNRIELHVTRYGSSL